MKRRTHMDRLIAVTLIAGFALSACGIRGDLKAPPPLWGDDKRTAEQKADAENKKEPESGITIQAPDPVE